jgi:hypothetical protein
MFENQQYMWQTGPQMNDMYSYTQAGLPATKRLQVNETVGYVDRNNQHHSSAVTANLDTVFTYNGEGGITSMTYPSTGNSTAPTAGPSYDSMYRLSGMTTSTGTGVVSGVGYNAANKLIA